MTDDLNLGRLLGRFEAFTAVAGRCSAAQADAMRTIRDKKLYAGHAKDFDEFCMKHFHTGKENANRIIRLLEEFGPTYFEVAQLTRVSPKTYRAIAPSIRGEALHHNGEAIALIPENAEKVAAAVAEIRRTAPAPAPAPAEAVNPIPALEKTCLEVLGRIEQIIGGREYPLQIEAVVSWMRDRLGRLEQTI